jgi:hypothetical protein
MDGRSLERIEEEKERRRRESREKGEHLAKLKP